MNRVAAKLASHLHRAKIIEADEIDYYIFGFERIILSTMMYIIIIITAVITRTLLESLIFAFSFTILRQFCGGYHCQTPWRCVFVSFVIYIFLLCSLFVNTTQFKIVFLSLSVVALIPVMLFAPIENINNPLSESEIQKYQLRAKVSSFIIITLSCLSFVMNVAVIYIPLSYAMIANSLLLLISICKGEHHEKTNLKNLS